jgi:hypothetical protein
MDFSMASTGKSDPDFFIKILPFDPNQQVLSFFLRRFAGQAVGVEFFRHHRLLIPLSRLGKRDKKGGGDVGAGIASFR